uniref:PA14 domain-containing protein n=1 Tax=Globisporangium ultimum (strain ATCC 200006 / CBS 805.95 / DAOM BR144) TaxID=431595 RepID=K3WGJ3_GLOUD
MAPRCSSYMLAALLLLVVAALTPVRAFECSACQYTVRNCTTLSSSSSDAVTATTTTTTSTLSVCDAEGKIQIDDVFCDSDECGCAAGKRCASLVIGCSNIFQARSRKRCIGNDTIQSRFQKCAIAQKLTTLNQTNLNADWMLFKDSAQCVSKDCAAVRQFHSSGVVQCGYLVVAWKDSDALYHFIVDGSRASDMAAGVFHYEVPFDGNAQIKSTLISETKVDECYALQTRNHKNGSCDGIYIQYDTSVQFFNSGDYQISKLDWGAYIAVVGSVAAAAMAVAAVAVVAYKFRNMDTSGADGVDDELLSDQQLDDVDEKLNKKKLANASMNHDLRQRVPSPSSSEDDEIAASTISMSTPV